MSLSSCSPLFDAARSGVVLDGDMKIHERS